MVGQKVTNKKYYMDGFLIDLLDHCAEREKLKFDNLLLIDGVTGAGKTTLAFQCAYYYADIMAKEFTVDNVFFDIQDMIEYAQSNKNKIIVWDEAAFDGMSMDWQNQNQRNLVKLVYTARKLGHFLIFIIPEIRKLQSVFALDKSFVLLRVYVRDGLRRGYWKGYHQGTKKILYYAERKYAGDTKVYPNIKGTFPNREDLIDMKAYENKKDAAIMTIGDKTMEKLKLTPEAVAKLKKAGLSTTEIADIGGCTPRWIQKLAQDANE